MSDIVERLEGTKHGLYWDVARDAMAEITRLRTLLSEAEQRARDARAKALEEVLPILAKEAEKAGHWNGSLSAIRDAVRSLQSEER